MGDLWLESYLLYAIIAAGVSVLASIILDSLDLNVISLPVKAHQQIVVLQQNFAGDDIYANKSELL